jgi:hypothetical protein
MFNRTSCYVKKINRIVKIEIIHNHKFTLTEVDVIIPEWSKLCKMYLLFIDSESDNIKDLENFKNSEYIALYNTNTEPTKILDSFKSDMWFAPAGCNRGKLFTKNKE